MKKVITVAVCFLLALGMTMTTTWAAGGKNHGDVGAGRVEQGGSGLGTSPGDDAQDRQTG